MRSRHITGGVVAVGSVVLALSLAAPVIATPPASHVWTTSGAAGNGSTMTFTAINQTQDFVIKDLRTNALINCVAGSVKIVGQALLAPSNPTSNTARIISLTTGNGCSSSGTAVSLAGAAYPWKINMPTQSYNPGPSSAAQPPVLGQQTDIDVSDFKATGSFNGATSCAFSLGLGIAGSTSAGTIAPITYLNGDQSSFSILTSNSPKIAMIGFNSTAGDASGGCQAGSFRGGDKVQILGVDARGTQGPVVFTETNIVTQNGTYATPLWFRAY